MALTLACGTLRPLPFATPPRNGLLSRKQSAVLGIGRKIEGDALAGYVIGHHPLNRAHRSARNDPRSGLEFYDGEWNPVNAGRIPDRRVGHGTEQ